MRGDVGVRKADRHKVHRLGNRRQGLKTACGLTISMGIGQWVGVREEDAEVYCQPCWQGRRPGA